VIRPDGEIVFTSADHGRLYRISGNQTGVLAQVGNSPGGATESRDGTIYVTQGAGERWGPNGTVGGIRSVGRDGSLGWLTQDPIAPNDLCFGPDGLLYATDPTRPRKSRDDGRLFRCNVETGEAELLCSVPWYPNGVGFGIDDALYVASTDESRIVRYSIDSGRLGKEETYVRMPSSYRPDGFLFDAQGNISIASLPFPRGAVLAQIQTYDRNGKLIDTLVATDIKHRYTNIALGADRMLVITNTGAASVLAVSGWPHAGLPLYPFRTAM
jgi:gluconolactonase